MSRELYSQLCNVLLQNRRRGKTGESYVRSIHQIRLVNENDAVLPMTAATFVGLMSLAEQRGWRATAFTCSDFGAFSAADASRCAVVMLSALEDGVPPSIAVGGERSASRVCVHPDEVKRFIELCRDGGFWIRAADGATANEAR